MESIQWTMNWSWGILVQLCVPALVWAMVIAGLIRIVKDRQKADRPVVWDEAEDETAEESLYEPASRAPACCRSSPTSIVIGEYVQKRS